MHPAHTTDCRIPLTVSTLLHAGVGFLFAIAIARKQQEYQQTFNAKQGLRLQLQENSDITTNVQCFSLSIVGMGGAAKTCW